MVTGARLDASPGGQVTVRYWASAKAAAGTGCDVIDVPGPVEVAALVEEAVRRHPDRGRLAEVLATCSVLVDGHPANRPGSMLVAPGSCVEMLPPFAGG